MTFFLPQWAVLFRTPSCQLKSTMALRRSTLYVLKEKNELNVMRVVLSKPGSVSNYPDVPMQRML